MEAFDLNLFCVVFLYCLEPLTFCDYVIGLVITVHPGSPYAVEIQT